MSMTSLRGNKYRLGTKISFATVYYVDQPFNPNIDMSGTAKQKGKIAGKRDANEKTDMSCLYLFVLFGNF